MGPIRATLADAGVTEQQWRVLRILKEEGPQEPTQIAERACLLLPSLTRILQKLEDKTLISRRPDPVDRRRQIVEITDSGAEIIHANMPTALQQAEHIRKMMGPERYEQLLDLLEDLHELEI